MGPDTAFGSPHPTGKKAQTSLFRTTGLSIFKFPLTLNHGSVFCRVKIRERKTPWGWNEDRREKWAGLGPPGWPVPVGACQSRMHLGHLEQKLAPGKSTADAAKVWVLLFLSSFTCSCGWKHVTSDGCPHPRVTKPWRALGPMLHTLHWQRGYLQTRGWAEPRAREAQLTKDRLPTLPTAPQA